MSRPKLTLLVVILICVACSARAMAQEAPVAEDEIDVSDGGIKLPMRNPFKPQIPAVVIEEKVEVPEEVLIEIEEGVYEVAEQAAEFVEPEITGTPRLYISGLIWNSERPQAIINGNIVEVGDRMFKINTDNRETIPEIKFVDISKEGVAVAYEDKIIILKPEPIAKE